MDIDNVRERIAEIEASRGDDEVAHGLEDQLHQDVLASIALGGVAAESIRAIAELALTTLDIDFARWCA